jgi:hypothetical protein
MLEVRHFVIYLNVNLIISKGLEFMHEHNVAHKYGPLSLITRWLIVNGSGMLAEGIIGSPFIFRSRPRGLFLHRFWIWTRFPSRDEMSLVTGRLGQNKTVPELSDTVPYDPFKVKIYQMGGVIQELVEVSIIQP